MKTLLILLLVVSCTDPKKVKKQVTDRIEFAEDQERVSLIYKLTTPDEQTECSELSHMQEIDDPNKVTMKLDGRIFLSKCISGFSYTLRTYSTDRSCFIDCQINHRYSDEVQNNCYRRCMKLYGQEGDKATISIAAP